MFRSKKKILTDFSSFSSLEVQNLNDFFEGKCKKLSKEEGDSVRWSTDTALVPHLWKYRYMYYVVCTLIIYLFDMYVFYFVY